MAFLMNSFKYALFLFNLIFFGLGLWVTYETVQQLGSDVTNLDAALKSPIYVTLLIGVIITFIAFLGCAGTCFENSCMIKTYAFFILVAAILQIAALVMLTKIDPEQISKGIKDRVITNYKAQAPSVKKSIQLLQQSYSCCGVDGYKDYSLDAKEIPNSCCQQYDDAKFTDNDPQVGKCELSDLQPVHGCKAKVTELVQGSAKSFYIAIGCVFAAQALVIILSCVLSKSIREQYNVV